MPTDHRLGLNEHEMTPPSTRPQPAKPHPKDAVALSTPQPRLTPKGDLQLMPEGKILEHQVAAPSEGCAGCASEKEEPSEHAPEYQPLATAATRPRIRIYFCRLQLNRPEFRGDSGVWFHAASP